MRSLGKAGLPCVKFRIASESVTWKHIFLRPEVVNYDPCELITCFYEYYSGVGPHPLICGILEASKPPRRTEQLWFTIPGSTKPKNVYSEELDRISSPTVASESSGKHDTLFQSWWHYWALLFEDRINIFGSLKSHPNAVVNIY